MDPGALVRIEHGVDHLREPIPEDGTIEFLELMGVELDAGEVLAGLNMEAWCVVVLRDFAIFAEGLERDDRLNFFGFACVGGDTKADGE